MHIEMGRTFPTKSTIINNYIRKDGYSCYLSSYYAGNSRV